MFIWPCLSRLLLHLQSPGQRYPINIRAGKAGGGHRDGVSIAGSWLGGDIHPKCAHSLCSSRVRKSPPRSGAPHGIKDAEQLLPRREFVGKTQRNVPGETIPKG